jgi:hypothetical protein
MAFELDAPGKTRWEQHRKRRQELDAHLAELERMALVMAKQCNLLRKNLYNLTYSLHEIKMGKKYETEPDTEEEKAD